MHCHFAIEKIWAYVTEIDQYIDRKKPWTLAKEARKDELSAVMTTLVEAVRLICVLAFPFIPAAVEKIWRGYGFGRIQDTKAFSGKDFAKIPFLISEHALAEQKLMIFPRIEIKAETVSESLPDKPAQEIPPSPPSSKEGGASLVDIADFSKIDLRVAKVLAAERVEKADKLLKLQVEIGAETRQIIAGIAEHYPPEALVGKRIVVVANLKPAKIRGIESRGMLLAAKAGGKLFIVTPDGEIDSDAKVG